MRHVLTETWYSEMVGFSFLTGSPDDQVPKSHKETFIVAYQLI